MNLAVNRRRFLAASLAALPVAAMPWANLRAFADVEYADIPPALREGHEIAAGFTRDERRLLEEAMAIFYRRFLSDEVLHADDNCCFERARINVGDNFPFQDFNDFNLPSDRWLLLIQLNLLQTKVLGSGKVKFPKVRLNYQNVPEGKYLAQAYVGVMRVATGHDGFAGKFELDVNAWYLHNARQADLSNPIYWAGVIAHELLHNLGHSHPQGRADADYYKTQLVVYEHALRANGQYTFGDEKTPVLCRRKVAE